MSKPYVTVARSKGLTEWNILRRHVARNTGVTTATIVGWEYVRMWGGAVFAIEYVFAWPGVGLLTINAAHRQDFFVPSGRGHRGWCLRDLQQPSDRYGLPVHRPQDRGQLMGIVVARRAGEDPARTSEHRVWGRLINMMGSRGWILLVLFLLLLVAASIVPGRVHPARS